MFYFLLVGLKTGSSHKKPTKPRMIRCHCNDRVRITDGREVLVELRLRGIAAQVAPVWCQRSRAVQRQIKGNRLCGEGGRVTELTGVLVPLHNTCWKKASPARTSSYLRNDKRTKPIRSFASRTRTHSGIERMGRVFVDSRITFAWISSIRWYVATS